MSIDTRTPAEIAYDSLKDGSAYIKQCPACGCELAVRAAYCDSCGAPTKPAGEQLLDILTKDTNSGVWDAIQAITDDPTDDGSDTPLSAGEEKALDILLATTPVIPSRDDAHRRQRWENILDQIADMDEAGQAEALRFMEQVLEAIRN